MTKVEKLELDIKKVENGFTGSIDVRADKYHYFSYVGHDLDSLWNSCKDKIYTLLTEGIEEEEDETESG